MSASSNQSQSSATATQLTTYAPKIDERTHAKIDPGRPSKKAKQKPVTVAPTTTSTLNQSVLASVPNSVPLAASAR